MNNIQAQLDNLIQYIAKTEESTDGEVKIWINLDHNPDPHQTPAPQGLTGPAVLAKNEKVAHVMHILCRSTNLSELIDYIETVCPKDNMHTITADGIFEVLSQCEIRLQNYELTSTIPFWSRHAYQKDMISKMEEKKTQLQAKGYKFCGLTPDDCPLRVIMNFVIHRSLSSFKILTPTTEDLNVLLDY